MTCDDGGYLVQNNGFYTVDLSTGVTESQRPVTEVTSFSIVDAIGYNVKDNYVYGLAQTVLSPGSLIRIGAGGVSQIIASGIAPNLFSGQTGLTFLAGDVDETGTLWVIANSLNAAGPIGQFWMTIDLSDPSSSTFGNVTGTGVTGVPYPILDWAYIPGGGDFLYALCNAPSKTILYKFDRTGHSWSPVADYGSVEGNAWGALFATSTGSLYAVDQYSAKLYSFAVADAIAANPADPPEAPVDISTTTIPLAALTFIDGARCANAAG